MKLLSKIRSVAKFAYDAVRTQAKRRAITPTNKSEDCEMTPEERQKLLTAARDLQRNFAVAAWAIRRHLDYVSSFSFQPKSNNKALDIRLEALMDNWGKRKNCEVTQRHRLPRLIRLLECQRVTAGDCFVVKLADGRVQALEGDRVRTPKSGLPDSITAADLTHGVQLDEAGAAKAYAVCRRTKNTVTFERMLDAENVFHHGYFERIDQVRGISPLAAAVNTYRDTYQAIDFTLAKLRVEQLFALCLYRDSDTSVAPTVSTTNEDGDSSYEVDWGAGPVQLDLKKEDKAEFLESKNPSANSQTFIQVCIQIALKALDIPYSFYAENFTNYSGARQALLQYQQAADIKRADNQELLDEITAWKLQQWIEDGLLDEFSAEDIASIWWEWIPTGIPWIDPLKEVTAQQKAIGSRLNSRTRICRSLGVSFPDLVDEIAAEEAYMKLKGVAISVDVEIQRIETESTAHSGDDAEVDIEDDPDAEKAGEVVVQ